MGITGESTPFSDTPIHLWLVILYLIYLSIYLSIHPSIDLSIYLSIYPSFLPSFFLSFFLSFFFVYLSLSLSLAFFFYIYIYICTSPYPRLYPHSIPWLFHQESTFNPINIPRPCDFVMDGRWSAWVRRWVMWWGTWKPLNRTKGKKKHWIIRLFEGYLEINILVFGVFWWCSFGMIGLFWGFIRLFFSVFFGWVGHYYILLPLMDPFRRNDWEWDLWPIVFGYG